MFPEQNTSPNSKSHLSEASRKKNTVYFEKIGFLSGTSFHCALVVKDIFPSD